MAAYWEKEIRLVLIGKTGVGKSSTGNSILGEERFKPVRGLMSGTGKCDWKQVRRNGFLIKVTDTPGVCDTHRSKDDVHREIAKCVTTCSPGPHAIVMVVRANSRFTEEEKAACNELKRLFGDEIFQFMVLAFTYADDCDKAAFEKEVKSLLAVQQIIKDASGRYVLFDNNQTCPWEKRQQYGDKLIDVVCRIMSQNQSAYYTTDLTKRVEDLIQTELKDMLQKEIRLLLIGKTGVGKSSTGNSILGQERFTVNGSFSYHHKSDWSRVHRNGFYIQVIDSSGLLDVDEVHRQLARCLVACSPGPHAIVMVLNASARFTEVERAAYNELKRLFGDDIARFMVLAFTHADDCDKALVEQEFKSYPFVGQIVKEASDRYVFFDNRENMPWEKRRQPGDKLIQIVRRMKSQNGNAFYTNATLKSTKLPIPAKENNDRYREELNQQIVDENRPGFLKGVINQIGSSFLGDKCLIM